MLMKPAKEGANQPDPQKGNPPQQPGPKPKGQPDPEPAPPGIAAAPEPRRIFNRNPSNITSEWIRRGWIETRVTGVTVVRPVLVGTKGNELVAFKQERDRIDELLNEEEGSSLDVASVKLTN